MRTMPINNSLLPRPVRFALLASIVILALGIRLYGIGFGAPFVYHPDEPSIVGTAIRMVSTGDLHPHYFKKPSLLIYINVGVVHLVHSVTDTPLPEDFSEGVKTVTRNPVFFPYYYWGRVTTALLGVLSILLVYAIGTRCHTPAAGLWAAFFLCIAPLHVGLSHIAQVDVPVTFMCLLSVLFTVRAFQESKLKDWALAGLFAGLAASTKYPQGLIVLPCLLALLCHPSRDKRWGRTFWLGSVGIGAMSLVGFVMGTPYAALDFFEFFEKGLAHEWEHYSTGHDGAEGSANWWWYLRRLYDGLGPPVAVAALIGFGSSLVRPSRETLILLSFPLVYFLFVSSFPVRFSRQMIPVLPFAALWAGAACDAFSRWLTERPSRTYDDGKRTAVTRFVVASMLAVLMGILPLYKAVESSYRRTLPDTRTAAFHWVRDNIRGKTIAHERYTPDVEYLPDLRTIKVNSLIQRDLNDYRSEGVMYLIASSGMYGRYFKELQKYGEQIERYEAIFRLPLVTEFKKSKTSRGPHIRIYRLVEP